MVGPGRFELPTSPLSGVRSNQLSYGPELSSVIGTASLKTALRQPPPFEEERETWAAMPAITPIPQPKSCGQGLVYVDNSLTGRRLVLKQTDTVVPGADPKIGGQEAVKGPSLERR